MSALKWGVVALWSKIRYGSKFVVLNDTEDQEASPQPQEAGAVAADLQVNSLTSC